MEAAEKMKFISTKCRVNSSQLGFYHGVSTITVTAKSEFSAGLGSGKYYGIRQN